MAPLGNTFEIAKIVAKYLQNSIEPREQAILDKWLNESEDHRVLFGQICSKSKIDKKLSSYSRIDWEKDYQEFIEKRNRKRTRFVPVRKFLRYAALFAIPLALGASLLFWDSINSVLFSDPVIPPGFSKATLVLADGKTYELNKDSTYTIYEVDGSALKNYQGQISYDTSELKLSDPSLKLNKLLTNQLFIPRNGEYKLTLVDGTKVWINSETYIEYFVSLEGDKRIVKLQGEAYFEVAHNPAKPFIVELGNSKVEVLGTSFNIKAYKDDYYITTTLSEGKVSFSSEAGGENFILNPGQQFELDKRNDVVTRRDVKASLYMSWKDGRFAFQNQRMEDILKTLSRWYDVEIVYEFEKIKDRRFTGDLKRYDDFNKLLKIMEESKLVKFEIEDKKIILKDI